MSPKKNRDGREQSCRSPVKDTILEFPGRTEKSHVLIRGSCSLSWTFKMLVSSVPIRSVMFVGENVF
jgi:hypothetical protein